jgi:replicative DNA helicase
MSEREMPHHDFAEAAALGGMLLSKTAIAEVMKVAKARDFYHPKHEQIFDAITTLYARNEPVDAITVSRELEKRGELTRIGGPAYLHTLMESAPTAANAGYHAEIVHDHAVRRRMIEAGVRISAMGYATDQSYDLPEVIGRAQAEVHALSRDLPAAESTPGGAMERFLESIDETTARGPVRCIPTGFADLDELTGGGLHPGQMVVVAGRPGLGKSTLGDDIAREASIRHRIPGIIFNFEMGEDEIVRRLIAAEAKVPLHHLRYGKMSETDWKRIAQRGYPILDAPLTIIDDVTLSMLDIASMCREAKRERDLGYAVIDYAQLLSSGTGRRHGTREQEVSEISRMTKLLAKELQIAIVLIAQLNRGPEQRADKKPQISDLRESGSLEQDADTVILLHRPDAYEAESPRAGETDLIVAKHRNGPCATITVAAQLHYARFIDMAREDDRAWQDAVAGGVR